MFSPRNRFLKLFFIIGAWNFSSRTCHHRESWKVKFLPCDCKKTFPSEKTSLQTVRKLFILSILLHNKSFLPWWCHRVTPWHHQTSLKVQFSFLDKKHPFNWKTSLYLVDHFPDRDVIGICYDIIETWKMLQRNWFLKLFIMRKVISFISTSVQRSHTIASSNCLKMRLLKCFCERTEKVTFHSIHINL